MAEVTVVVGERLLVEYDTPDALRSAVAHVSQRGVARLDAYTPFPVEGLDDLIGFRETIIPWATLGGGLFGIALAMAMQAGTVLDYPLNVGGRPPLAWPAFCVVAFELMVLFSVGFAIAAMLFLNRLPRLHQALFDAPRFSLASNDRFFLAIDTPERLDDDEVAALLEGTGQRSVERVAP